MTFDDIRDDLAKQFIISMISGNGTQFPSSSIVIRAYELANEYLKRVYPDRIAEK